MYTYEYIKSKIDSRLYNQYDSFYVLNIQNELNAIHNHDRISLEFLKSNFYKDNNKVNEWHHIFDNVYDGNVILKKLKELYITPYNEFLQIDEFIVNKECYAINFDDLKKYLYPFINHLSADLAVNNNLGNPYLRVFTRHTCNKINELNEYDVTQCLNFAHHLYEISTIENFNYETIIPPITWHKYLQIIWALIQTGVGEVALYLSKILYKLFIIRDDNNKSAISKVFNNTLAADHTLRINSTLSWCLAWSYKQIGDITNYEKTLKDMVNLYDFKRHDIDYVISNRYTEAYLLLYELDSSIYNLQKVFEMFHHNCTFKPHEITENIREKGWIVLDFIDKIFKKKI